MILYSTADKTHQVAFKQAILHSLAPNKGLYVPVEIPEIQKGKLEDLLKLPFQEMVVQLTNYWLGNEFTIGQLERLVGDVLDFPAPLIKVTENISSLELWHGPSMAFKDFGARFMASFMSYYWQQQNDSKLTVLVATSGDTGGAVAAGFYNVPSIDVIILYPKGRVSDVQEKQLTTLGNNITALEVDGTFDDCQDMVKSAFSDPRLNAYYNFSSANSINIARLIPQSFYYFEGYKQLDLHDRSCVFCVPSGNFGNLTAGLIAQQMGLPIDRFIAATNLNNTVPRYLQTGRYEPMTSIKTLSNAMDVGKPSNFERIIALFPEFEGLRDLIFGHETTDTQTLACIKKVYKEHRYLLDPHGAVAYDALDNFLSKHDGYAGVLLETAHPCKFLDVMYQVVDRDSIPIPNKVRKLMDRDKVATPITADYSSFYSYLMDQR